MKQLKKYVWVFEWICVALLVAMAIVTVVKMELLYYAIGIIFVIFGALRVVPLIRTTESKAIKWFIAIEAIIDVAAGVILLVWAMNEETDQGSIVGYMIGIVLYLRGFIHFLSTSVKDEPTDLVSFFVNIGLITLATVIITKGGFSATILKWVFFIVIFIIAIIFALRGYKDYRSYRGELVGSSKLKKVSPQPEETETTQVDTNPTSDEIIIPEVDKDRPSDSI